jgi:hypothetical protein
LYFVILILNSSCCISYLASLLPSSDIRSVKTPPRKSVSGTSAYRLFSRTKLIALVGHQFNDEHDKINIYSDLGVELLHILKYTCVNAAGIRKISKKYAKLINFFPVAQEADNAKAKEDNELLMPKEVAQRYETIAESRIDQITNNKDFATVSELNLFLLCYSISFTIIIDTLLIDLRITSRCP